MLKTLKYVFVQILYKNIIRVQVLEPQKQLLL